jgi:hypothetical protein
VTVLQPLQIRVLPPLTGDSTPAFPNGSTMNVAKAGSTVPVKVTLAACGVDVTATAPVTLRLATLFKTSDSDPGVSVVPTFNGAGDAGGVMIWDGSQYHYNLDTNGYPVTVGNPSFFQLNVVATYNSAPSIPVGSDSLMLDTK